MKEAIELKLKELEREAGIRILYACESGSRAWGFASPDSDFDIRFIYKREASFYLSLWERKDTLEFMTPDNLDGSGWDLDKTLRLLAKSNGPLLEWLHSPIVYRSGEAFLEPMRRFADDCFSPVATAWHYLGAAETHLEKMRGDEATLKTYFYALRNALAAQWITERKTMPPVPFSGLMSLLDGTLLGKVNALMEVKQNNLEKHKVFKDEQLVSFLENVLERCRERAAGLPQGIKIPGRMDEFFVHEVLM